MNWVLDASAGLEVAKGGPQASKLDRYVTGINEILAPSIYYAEVFNAAWKYFQFGSESKESCLSLANYCTNLVEEFYPIELLSESAFRIAAQTGCSVYDAYYLSLAVNQKCGLLSLDKKLIRIAEGLEIPTS